MAPHWNPGSVRLLASESVDADGEVVLHAFPRMLGYVFNPVSFWVCHDREGRVRAVLCEVCNTFGEQHNYLLAHPDGRPLVSGETLRARKVLHVSPFCEVKGGYRFRFHFAPSAGSRESTTTTTPAMHCSRLRSLARRRR